MVKQQMKEDKVRVKWSDLLESDMPEFIKGPEQSKMMDRLYPHYQSYISPVNPLFLSTVPSLDMLNSKRMWAARDGLVPLLFFFTKFKTPKGLNSKILIDKDLLDCVPEAWRSHVGSYYLQAKDNSVETEKAFIYGVNSEVFMSKESVALGLERFVERKQASKGAWKEVWLYLSMRQYTSHENPRHHAQMSVEILRRTGFEVKIVDLQEILGVQSWAGWEIFDLHKKTILADGWMSQALLSRGAHIPVRKRPTDTEVVHLSAHHDCVIQWDLDWPKTKMQDRQEEMRELLQGIEAKSFDWKKIFTEVRPAKAKRRR